MNAPDQLDSRPPAPQSLLDLPGGPTAILRLARELWCVVDHRGRFAQRGGPWVELFGWGEGVFGRARFWELLHPGDVRRARGVGRELGADPSCFTARMLSGFGSYVLVEWRVQRTGSAGLLVVGSELGDAHGAVQQLREARARYRGLCDAAFEAILVHEAGVVIDANAAACRMFGHPREALVGMDVLELVAEGERGHEHAATDGYRRHADGRTFAVTVRAQTIELGGGRQQQLEVLRLRDDGRDAT